MRFQKQRITWIFPFVDLVSLVRLTGWLNYIYANITSGINFVHINFTNETKLRVLYFSFYAINFFPNFINLFLHNHVCLRFQVENFTCFFKSEPYRIILIIVLFWEHIIVIWVRSEFLNFLERFVKFFVDMSIGHIWRLFTNWKHLIYCILFLGMLYFSNMFLNLRLFFLLIIFILSFILHLIFFYNLIIKLLLSPMIWFFFQKWKDSP